MKYINLLLTGRGGIDDLNKFLFVLYLIFLFITTFFIRNMFLDLFVVFLFVLIIYRTLSKNVYRRVKENRIYLNIIGPIREPFRFIIKKFKSNNTSSNIYKKCPKCHQELKLRRPKSRGIKHTTCPKCSKRFGFLVVKKRK